ncbi:ribosomal subunit 39S-domain-containing protein [Xylariales sp. PMI_506]|nr:ribosomal subunit 39S-domain-containing protein [Xylariales sp. PMI_506]
MRRIARLRKPSGWSCTTAAPRASIASNFSAAQCSQRRAGAAAPSGLRFYSDKPSSLPASLVDQSSASSDLTSGLGSAELDEVTGDLQTAFRIPPQRQTAQRPTAVNDPTYVPAVSEDGLAVVGGFRGWWDRRENWPASQDFQGFKAAKKVQQREILEVAVRRAVVEAVLLRSLGRAQDLVDGLPLGGAEAGKRCLDLDLRVSGGEGTVAGDVEAVTRDLSWESAEAAAVEEANLEEEAKAGIMPSLQESIAYAQRWDDSWKEISLADSHFKFAVAKRIFQLTGQLIPDYRINSIQTVQTLLDVIKAPPKPRTLTQEIQRNRDDLVEMPNVTFAGKRVTRGDKAIALGQYKLIESEFVKRDLQDGHRAVAPNREKHWVKGDA